MTTCGSTWKVVMSKASNSINRNLLLFDSLIEQSPDLIYFKDRESRFIKINKSLAAMYGLENPDQAAGKSDFDFLTDDEARVSREEEKQVMETETVNCLEKSKGLDGCFMLRTE
jgi:two-component system, sensor histidine kinase and response regulator